MAEYIPETFSESAIRRLSPSDLAAQLPAVLGEMKRTAATSRENVEAAGTAAGVAFAGAAAVPPMVATDVGAAVQELNAAIAALPPPEDHVAQSGQAIDFTVFLPAPGAGQRIKITRGGVDDEYEWVDTSGPPAGWACAHPGTIAVPFGVASEGRTNLVAAINGTAVPTVPAVQDSGGVGDAPVIGTHPYRAVLLEDQTSVLIQAADALGGNPIFDQAVTFGDVVESVNLVPPNMILEAVSAGFLAPNAMLPMSRQQVASQIGASLVGVPTVWRSTIDLSTLQGAGKVKTFDFPINPPSLSAQQIILGAAVRVVTVLKDGVAAGTFTADLLLGGATLLAAPVDVSTAPDVESRMSAGLSVMPWGAPARGLVLRVVDGGGTVDLENLAAGEIIVYTVVATA